MKRAILVSAVAAVALVSVGSAFGQTTMVPKTSFGNGDGWLAPGEGGITYLVGTGDTQRGLAYNPVTKNLLLVSRAAVPTGQAADIRILDSTTGANITNSVTGSLRLNATTNVVTGGTFALSTIGVTSDGVIYAANLTGNTGINPANQALGTYKVYRWQDESATPTTYYNGNAGADFVRVGDSFAITGSDSDGTTRIAAGFTTGAANTTQSLRNSYTVISAPVSPATTPTAFAVTGIPTPPIVGDFRLGLTFRDSNTVWGSQGNGVFRRTTFDAAGTGTFQGSSTIDTLAGSSERQLGFTTLGGRPILATLHSTGTASQATASELSSNGNVFIYDVTNPATPVFQARLRIPAFNTTNGQTGAFVTNNGNAQGAIAWGEKTSPRTQSLYVLTTNQGIQAFDVSVPVVTGWTNPDGGTWNTTNSWAAGIIPDVAGDDASFGSVITANRDVTVDSDVSVKSITLNNSAFSYTIKGPNKITLQGSTGTTNSPAITVTAGTHTISAPVQIDRGTLVTVPSNTTLTMGRVTSPSGRTFNVTGVAGTVKITELLQMGQLTIGSNAPSGTLAIVQGNLDITTAPLIVSRNFTSEASLNVAIASWWNNGAKDGRGIGSSVAAANELTTLGVIGGVTGNVGGYGTFAGYVTTPTDLIVRYAYLGDTNLDGVVSDLDLTTLIKSIRANLTTPGSATGWQNGDTNYDGLIDGVDYANLLTAYRFQGASLAPLDSVGTGSGAGVIPEPAALGLLLAGLPLVSRRRR